MTAIIDFGICDFVELTSTLSELGETFTITDNETEILKADKLILPNTNQLAKAVKQLHLLNLFSMLRMLNKPILGIANGMRLMCEFAKDENTACLGLFPVTTCKQDLTYNEEFNSSFHKIKIVNKTDPLFHSLPEESVFFFEQCYELPVVELTSAVLSKNKDCSVSLKKNNFYAVQFIPEKSGEDGKIILSNFIKL